jgi:hypothetical protein
MPFDKIQVKFTVPFLGEIGGEWSPDKSEIQAAWEFYVELATRVSIIELKPDEGLLREALDSLYSLFGIAREILRRHGPALARTEGYKMSFGYLTIVVLNTVLRPLLSKWHPLLQDYESRKPPERSPLEHERLWKYSDELRGELNFVRSKILEYARYLEIAADVKSLIIKLPDATKKVL